MTWAVRPWPAPRSSRWWSWRPARVAEEDEAAHPDWTTAAVLCAAADKAQRS